MMAFLPSAFSMADDEFGERGGLIFTKIEDLKWRPAVA